MIAVVGGSGAVHGAEPTVGVVVLSMGDRPEELVRCVDSVRRQRGVALDIVCVGNGWEPDGLGAGVRTIALAENIGIPAARNLGARAAQGELIFFLDDDAWVPDPHLLRDIAGQFHREIDLGAVQPRVCDPDGRTMRRWVPRVRVGDPSVAGPAFTLAEGVTVIRRIAFEAVAGWAENFFYGHEGIDLAWRMWDADWRLHYAGGLIVHHPATTPDRHDMFYRLNARNRVWVARRNLPWLLVPLYLGSWTAITVARLARRPAALRMWWGGFADGWRTNPGERRPMRWSTVLRLTRLGQPPIV